MTDSKTATERLRELLDALGVRYEKSEDDTTIYYDEGKRYTYSVNPESGWAQLFGYHLTPEQAINVTLESEREKQLELLVKQLWYLVNHRSGYGYAAALEAIEELGIEVVG